MVLLALLALYQPARTHVLSNGVYPKAAFQSISERSCPGDRLPPPQPWLMIDCSNTSITYEAAYESFGIDRSRSDFLIARRFPEQSVVTAYFSPNPPTGQFYAVGPPGIFSSNVKSGMFQIVDRHIFGRNQFGLIEYKFHTRSPNDPILSTMIVSADGLVQCRNYGGIPKPSYHSPNPFAICSITGVARKFGMSVKISSDALTALPVVIERAIELMSSAASR